MSGSCSRLHNPKVAETVLGAVMITVQVLLLTVAHPAQFLNFWPLAGVAVTVPLPLLATVSTGRVKLAVTMRAALVGIVQVGALPVQAPPQPAKVEPVVGVAVRVTLAPLAKLATQAAPQLMPAGLLATVPRPTPVL